MKLYHKLLVAAGTLMAAQYSSAAGTTVTSFGSANSSSSLLTQDPTGGKTADDLLKSGNSFITNLVDVGLIAATAIGVFYAIGGLMKLNKIKSEGRDESPAPAYWKIGIGGGMGAISFIVFAVRNTIMSS